MIKLTCAFAMAVAAVAGSNLAKAQTTDGFRAEAHLGYDDLPTDRASQVRQRGGDGLLLGGGIGYDFDLGGVVFGPEVNLDFTTAKASFTGFPAGYPSETKGGRDLDLSLRAGFRGGAGTLLYLKAGYDNARFKSVASLGTFRANDEGWRVGAGVEQCLGSHTYAKLEYRYTNYGRIASFDDYNSRHQVVAGFGIRF